MTSTGYMLLVLAARTLGMLYMGVSRSADRRIAELCAESPVQLELLAAIPCRGKRSAYGLREQLHAGLVADHSHDGWYVDKPEVRMRLNTLLSQDGGRVDRAKLQKMDKVA
jgi:hypothetical protein